MTTINNEDDFVEFEESDSNSNQVVPITHVEEPFLASVDLKQLEIKLCLDFKIKSKINDSLYVEQGNTSSKSEFESFQDDLTLNKSNISNHKVNHNNFYLDIERCNQGNLWGNIRTDRQDLVNTEVNFMNLEFYEVISLSKKFEKSNRKKKKSHSLGSSNVSKAEIMKLHSKLINLKNIYLKLSEFTLEDLFQDKVVKDSFSKNIENINDFSFIEDFQQYNDQLDFKKTIDLDYETENRFPNLQTNITTKDKSNNFETINCVKRER